MAHGKTMANGVRMSRSNVQRMPEGIRTKRGTWREFMTRQHPHSTPAVCGAGLEKMRECAFESVGFARAGLQGLRAPR